ncbi:hypothetical protein N7490_001843 [Penicillium lividum]|nr:hypothetical protein N7490_001843 [Penicillium lividum]
MGHFTPENHQEYGLFNGRHAWDLTADNAHIQSFGAIDHHFAASLQSILDGSFIPPKSPDDLDYELMAYLYRELLNAKLYESHMALHALNILQRDERMPGSSRHEIHMFFQHSSEFMAISWKVFKNFKHASTNRDSLQYDQSFPDTASFAIRGCLDDCFIQLLQNKAISPSGFNSAGQSFFFLAFHEDRLDIARELLSKMSVEHILEPAFIMAGIRQRSFLEISVINAELFNICWTKIESNPNLDLSNVLKQRHYAHVCRYATPDLASRMLARGVDLAYIANALSLVTWPEMAQYHPNPESFFDWLRLRGCWPFSTEAGPCTPLLAAAQHDRFEATNWLLWNNHNAREQWKCAIDAAESQTEGSARILDLFLTRISLAVPPHPLRWPQDIACKVIQAACNQSQVSGAENLRFTQDLAMRKLRSVKLSAPDLLVYSKDSLSSAKQAGLTDLLDFLRAGEREALNMIEDSC